MIANTATQPDQVLPGHRSNRLFVVILVGAVVVFCFTYLLAGWSADRLATAYLADADASYRAGHYLDALVGYQEFDPASQRYVQRGGYMQVKGIWASPYARPVPAGVPEAQQKIDDIVNKRLTIDDAEQFVQANTGQANPYLGIIYLRLGELYEAANRLSDAKDVYQSIPSLFPDDAALIAHAQADLQALQKKNPGG